MILIEIHDVSVIISLISFAENLIAYYQSKSFFTYIYAIFIGISTSFFSFDPKKDHLFLLK